MSMLCVTVFVLMVTFFFTACSLILFTIYIGSDAILFT